MGPVVRRVAAVCVLCLPVAVVAAPGVAGDVFRLGYYDGGTAPAPIQGGLYFDPIQQSAFVSDGGTWTILTGSGAVSMLTLLQMAAAPASPDAGSSELFVFLDGGMPSILQPDGLAYPLLTPGLGGGRCWMAPTGASTGTDSAVKLGYGVTQQGNLVGAPAISSASYYAGQIRRTDRSVNTANNACGVRMPYAFSWMENGFFYTARFGIDTTSSDDRLFVGVNTTLGQMTNADPSTFTDGMYFGCDDTDANAISFCTNDNSGSATCSSFGTNYPCRTAGATYDVWMYVPPGGGAVSYAIRRLDSAYFSYGTTSTDLPASTGLLGWHIWYNNGPSGLNVVLIGSMWVCTWVP